MTYAGNALETGNVFSYDRQQRLIVFDASIWAELVLLSHWITDAVILRWAELTSELAHGAVKASAIVDLLLTKPVSERDVADARASYSQKPLECVWTGKSLKRGFDVDHIIPYSLWHNNDLWNLVPALPAVNSQKRDRLPTHDLLVHRRPSLTCCWNALRHYHPLRFDHEVCRVLGWSTMNPDWTDHVFHFVSQAVETTSLQRGCERWQPA